MNKNLVYVLIRDLVGNMEDHVSLVKHVDDDAFDGLDKLEILYLHVDAMSKASDKWTKGKPLKESRVYGGFGTQFIDVAGGISFVQQR